MLKHSAYIICFKILKTFPLKTVIIVWDLVFQDFCLGREIEVVPPDRILHAAGDPGAKAPVMPL